jgi:DNA topoisomerase-3
VKTRRGKERKGRKTTARVAMTRSQPRQQIEARPSSNGLVAALKEWRLAVARQKRIPAFRILTDRALQAVAERQPISMDELGEVSGIGPKFLQSYGKQVLGVCEQSG